MVIENCPTIRLKDVLPTSYKAWKANLLKEGSIEIGGMQIKFSQSRMTHGGIRLWLTCPGCDRRCNVISQHPITGQVGCRVCLGLLYRKQRYKGMIEEMKMNYEKDFSKKKGSRAQLL